MPSQTISLCMIVKDEEQMLPACLESVQGAVDEIIVVDTGSTDNTVQLAESYGASIVHFTWSHDFAAARNAGLEAAAGDWILFLDADERIDEQGARELPIWAQQDGIEGYFLQIHNYTGNGSGGVTINPVLRMFRHRPEYRFQGRIHEQIAESIVSQRTEAHFHMTDVIIHHYGYSETIVSAKNKVNRNMELLQQIIEEDPGNPFHDYNLGVEYLRMGELQQALRCFQKSWSGLDPARVSYAHLVLKYEVRCLQALGQWGEAMEKIAEGRRLYPGYTDLLHAEAFTQNTLGRTEEAEKILQEALHMGPAAEMYHTEEGIGTFQTLYMLGQYAEQREALEEAVDAYVEAVRYKPSLLPPLYRICRILQVTRQEERLPELIEARFRIESQEAMWKMIGILNDSRCYLAVLSILQEWDQPSVLHKTIHVSKPMARWRSGDWESAARLLHENPDFSEQEKDWLMWSLDIPSGAGKKQVFKDQAILLIEQGIDKELKPLTEETWSSFAELLEAADHAGKREMFVGITGVWRSILEKNREALSETALVGTKKYVSSMVSAADGHLSAIQTQANGDVNTRLVQHIRLRLPWPDGFR
ncbi:glycosyltransferase [Paenibacillus polygoni]|uniref:Glycosyltransferase n=1 Tax=Paenibacillus polygoni TaxID=3050112 RepID=A0ABY8X0R5_9BACL|nr:TPR domain-containing glycosyltransferase [Paenibacillus polygoni]WIV19071.1 glycosyltransferase [Paenibacillus polygoni]